MMLFLVATNVVASRPPERRADRLERRTLVPKIKVAHSWMIILQMIPGFLPVIPALFCQLDSKLAIVGMSTCLPVCSSKLYNHCATL